MAEDKVNIYVGDIQDGQKPWAVLDLDVREIKHPG